MTTHIWHKLMNYANYHKVKVLLRDCASGQGFIGTSTPTAPFRINIYRFNQISIAQKIYTLAHELGHVQDFQKGTSLLYEVAKMNLSNNEILSDRERQEILKREHRASAFGREILVSLGLTQLDHYDLDASINIKFYKELFDKAANYEVAT